MASFDPTTITLSLDRLAQATRAQVEGGLQLAAEHVLARATELVPIEEGTLQRSGTVSIDAMGTTAAVSYDTPYAARQHEELTWHHKDGRQAKFLEAPMNDPGVQQGCRQILAQVIGRAWK